jgi:hypothetical protein
MIDFVDRFPAPIASWRVGRFDGEYIQWIRACRAEDTVGFVLSGWAAGLGGWRNVLLMPSSYRRNRRRVVRDVVAGARAVRVNCLGRVVREQYDGRTESRLLVQAVCPCVTSSGEGCTYRVVRDRKEG